MDNKTLRTTFRALPSDIKDWLFSEKVTYSVAELNTRLNIKGERAGVVAKLVARLVVQDLDTRDFVNELAIELNVSNSAAKAITKEVEEKVLHPIEASLRANLGIDVAMLHMGNEVSLSSITPLPDEAEKTPAPRTPFSVPDAAKSEATPHIFAPMAPKVSDTKTPSGPFILHTEQEPAKPIAPPINAPQRPTFSIKIPLAQKKYGAPPVTARIETGAPETRTPETQKTSEFQGSRIIPVPPLRQSLTIQPPRRPVSFEPIQPSTANQAPLKITPPPLRRLPPLPPLIKPQNQQITTAPSAAPKQEISILPINPALPVKPSVPAPIPARPAAPPLTLPPKVSSPAAPKPPMPQIPLKTPTNTVNIQKVVHYSDFFTKLQ